MSLSSAFLLLRLQKNRIVPIQYAIQINCYAKAAPAAVAGGAKGKKKLKLGPVLEKKVIPVETDPHKLVNFVCGSNILKEGKDVEIKPDSEYPDWLWDLYIGPPRKLEDMDPNSKEYWKRVKKEALIKHNLLAKLKPF